LLSIKHIIPALAATLGVCGSPSYAQPPVALASPPLNYDDASHWVCLPGSSAKCRDDLTATVLRADGASRLETFRPATAPDADCFYVYPTVSLSPGLSAAPFVTPAEHRAVRQQAERFTALCRLFAPIYRQITATSMKPDFPPQTEQAKQAAGRMAEDDVFAAWDYYMAHYNGGRPIILIGHSQGAFMVIGLLQRRIEGRPVQRQLVSAIVPGAGVMVPKGEQVGGTFKTIPPCRSQTQTGCVIAFNTIRADRALPAEMKERISGQQTVCTNPAALGGGVGVLKPYLSTSGETIIPSLTGEQGAWRRDHRAIPSPFVTEPGLYYAQCRADAHGAFLAVSTRPQPMDARTGSFVGDWMVGGVPEPTMGLHLVDLNLTSGNLVDVLRHQVASLRAKTAAIP